MKLIIVPIVAILAVTTLEIVAMLQGINGTMLGLALVAVAGLGGYEIKVLKDKITRPK